jgi:glycosyltransferase involved in cell wall biosynthesis
MLRIAFLLESTVLCGGVKVVLNLAQALQASGYDVAVISNGSYPDWFYGHLNFICHNPFARDAVQPFDYVVATSFRLVNTHARHTAPGQLVHLVQGYEGGLSECEHMLEQIHQAYTLPVPKLTISESLTRRLASLFPQGRFHTVGQGLEHDVFYPSASWKDEIKNRPACLFLVGPATISVKQIYIGLHAFKQAQKGHPELRLVRISTVDTRVGEERIAGQIEEYHVHLSSQSIGELFRNKNGILLASSGPGEGFGLPPLEAMACAVPVVMSDIPSFQNFSQPADYARFVRHDNPADMAEGICELISDGTRRMQLAERGLQVAREYSYEQVAERLAGVLFSCMGDLAG